MQKPKGTYDVFGLYGKKLKNIEKVIESLMEKYNYEYFRTPIFEQSELFHRGIGETSDIVSKETYDFKDRKDRNMTLRPEGTAGVVRSYIENKMYSNNVQPVKTWYYGPMYRYERPQAGRFREFYQFGVEVFGSNSPLLDAEIISIPVYLYNILGLKNIKVKINSLGDEESRFKYRDALIDYLKPHILNLCLDCQARYEKNPLRIIDCKVDKDSEILKNAPLIKDYLNENSSNHFESVLSVLKKLDIEYEVDYSIVRGLDYYTHTVFEVVSETKLGTVVLCGGGRYNNLIQELGGPDTPGVGFAIGMERLLNVLEEENIDLDINTTIDAYIIPLSEEIRNHALVLANSLRLNGFVVDYDLLNRNLKANFKQSEKLNAKYVIIIGEDEVVNNYVTIKNNHTKIEAKVKLEDLVDYLDEIECSCEHCEEDL